MVLKTPERHAIQSTEHAEVSPDCFGDHRAACQHEAMALRLGMACQIWQQSLSRFGSSPRQKWPVPQGVFSFAGCRARALQAAVSQVAGHRSLCGSQIVLCRLHVRRYYILCDAMSLCDCHGCQLVCVALVYSETMSATATSSLVPRLLQYAREKVASAQPAILSNLARVTQLPLIIDVALPGAAYFSVAAGGLCDVLYLLGEEARSITMAKEFMKGSCFVLTMLLE